MNHTTKMFSPRICLAAVALLCSLASLYGQTLPSATTNNNSFQEDRILVIVETSAAMQKRAENVQKLVGETISSGLGGDMRSGDTVGMWTFNTELNAGQFPLQRWTKASRQRVALAMVQFIQQQKFEKSARPAVIWETLTNVVAHSERITIILISSGNEAITGTPFDESIAKNFSKNMDAQRKAKMPFVTILRAFQGKFTSFSVNMAPWAIELPEYPKDARRAPEPATPKPIVAVTKPAPAPPAITANTTVFATNIPVTAPIPEPVAVTNIAKAEITSAVQETKTVPVTKPEPIANQVESALPKPPPDEPTATSSGKQKAPLPVVTILVAGIALLIGIMVVFIALLRWTRRSGGESLITRTMNKKDG